MKSGLVGKALLFDFNMKWTLEKKTYDCFVILFFVLLLYLVVSFIWLGNFSGVLFLLQCLQKMAQEICNIIGPCAAAGCVEGPRKLRISPFPGQPTQGEAAKSAVVLASPNCIDTSFVAGNSSGLTTVHQTQRSVGCAEVYPASNVDNITVNHKNLKRSYEKIDQELTGPMCGIDGCLTESYTCLFNSILSFRPDTRSLVEYENSKYTVTLHHYANFFFRKDPAFHYKEVSSRASLSSGLFSTVRSFYCIDAGSRVGSSSYSTIDSLSLYGGSSNSGSDRLEFTAPAPLAHSDLTLDTEEFSSYEKTLDLAIDIIKNIS